MEFDQRCSLFALFFGMAAISCLSAVFFVGSGVQTSEVPFSLAFREGTSDSAIQELYATIRALPGIVSVDYQTSSRAHRLLQEEDPQEMAFFEKHHIDNPFSHALLVTLRSPAALNAFREFIASSQWKDDIQPSSFLAERHAGSLRALSSLAMVRMIFFGVFILVFYVSILVFAEMLSRFALESGDITVGALSGMPLSSVLLSHTISLGFIVLCAFCAGYGMTFLLLYRFEVLHVLSPSFGKILGVFVGEIVVTLLLGHGIALWRIGRLLRKSVLGPRL